MATPGSVVNSGNLVTPGGAQGLTGTPAWTLTSSSFTVPAVNSAVTVNVNDTSWMAVGEVVWVANADQTGTLAAPFQVQSIAGNVVTLLNVSTSGQTLGDMLRSVYDTNTNNIVDLAEKLSFASGNSTDYVGGDNLCHALAAAVAALFTWNPVTLTVVPGGGAITAQTSNSYYIKIGRLVFIQCNVSISNYGTATGTTSINGLPAQPTGGQALYLRENAVTGISYSWILSATSPGGVLYSYTNQPPAWNNNAFIGTGIYISTT